MLTCYENHGKVEEIGDGTNQSHFPTKIKKVVETRQYMPQWQSSTKIMFNKDLLNV